MPAHKRPEGDMAQTGARTVSDRTTTEQQRTAPAPRRFRQRFLCGVSALAFIVSVAMPVTVDATSNAPAFKTALAGNENGTGDGQDRGRGNGKGRGDENGGGNKKLPDDDDDDDVDDIDDEGAGNDSQPGDGADATGPDDDIDEIAYGESTGAVAGVSTGTPAVTPPTIQQIFSLGEDSVLSAEEELLAIQNGWGAPPN